MASLGMKSISGECRARHRNLRGVDVLFSDVLAVGYEDGTIHVHAVDTNVTKVEPLFTIPQG